MFDDFQANTSYESRKRISGSMAAASVLYGGLIMLVISATTVTSKKFVEHLTQVEFAPPPPPPPPPPPEAMAAAEPLKNLRPKAKRKELKPPDEVPKQKPRESDAALAESENKGPVDGFLDGVEGGTGNKVASVAPAAAPVPAPSKPQAVVRPVADKSNPQPPYSASAKRKEIEGIVVVAFDVVENGTVHNAQILSGPEEFRDSVLHTVVRWRFRPATRGGQPTRYRMTTSIRFQLTDA